MIIVEAPIVIKGKGTEDYTWGYIDWIQFGHREAFGYWSPTLAVLAYIDHIKVVLGTYCCHLDLKPSYLHQPKLSLALKICCQCHQLALKMYSGTSLIQFLIHF